MQTEQTQLSVPVFLQTVSAAVRQLKHQLQHDYEQAYPDLSEIVHLVLDEEEANAWKLTLFPHLVLPDLVETHIARLNLQPAKSKHDDVFSSRLVDQVEPYQSTYALCG